MTVTIRYDVPTFSSEFNYSPNVYYNQYGNVYSSELINIDMSKAYKIKNIELKFKSSLTLPENSMIILFFSYFENFYYISVPISTIPITYKPENTYVYPYLSIFFISDSGNKIIRDLQVIVEIDENDIKENPKPIEKINDCLYDSNGGILFNNDVNNYMLDYEKCPPLPRVTTLIPTPTNPNEIIQPSYLSTGQIVAIVFGCIVGIFILCLIIFRKKIF